MRRNMRFIVTGWAAITACLVGCGKPQQAPPGERPTGKPKTIRIGMIAKSSTNPVFLSARTGAEAAARELSKEHGIQIKIDWRTPPTEDGQVQAQRITQAVNEGDNVVLISCSDASKVTGAINDAVARGVPVMTFDSDAPDSKRFAFYGVDDVKTGELVMSELARQLKGMGDVAILAGNQNAPNLRKRVQGVKKEAAKYPEIKIVDTFYHIETPQDAAAEVVRVMNAYPEIDGWAMVGGWPLLSTPYPRSSRTSKKGSLPCCGRSRPIFGATCRWRRSSTRSIFTRKCPRSIPWSWNAFPKRIWESGLAS